MTEGFPRDETGLQPCDWCGGPIQQPAIGRRRLYCGRTCRELAYRERKTQRRVKEAVKAAAAPDSTVDETADPVTTVDETRRPLPAPRRAGRRRSGMTAQAMPLFVDGTETAGH